MVGEHYPTKKYLMSQLKYPIIDIRTEAEWIETGICKDSYPITFFDEMGQYDIDDFLQQVNKILPSQRSRFLLICRTGQRTDFISKYLSNKGYAVINLKGGIEYVIQHQSCEIVEYQK